MWVLVKNVANRKCKNVESCELLQLDTNAYRYQPFEPKSRDDFHSKQHYGIIDGDYIVHYYILAIRDTASEIDEIIRDPRKHKLSNPPRISIGDTKDLLTKYERVRESDSAKANVKDGKVVKETAIRKKEGDILKKHSKFIVTNSKTSGLSSADKGVKSSTPVKLNYDSLWKCKQATEPYGIDKIEKSLEGGGSSTAVDKSYNGSEPLLGNSSHVDHEVLCESKKKIVDLELQLKIACEENELLRHLNDALEKKVISLRKDIVNDIKVAIKTDSVEKPDPGICFVAKSIPDLPLLEPGTESPKGQVECNSPDVSNQLELIVFKILLPRVVDQHHIDLLEVHVGGGHLVKISALKNIDINETKYTGRVNLLAQAFYGENLVKYALQPKDGDNLITINKEHLNSMQTFLKNMKWKPNKDGDLPNLSISNLNNAMKHITWNARHTAFLKSMSPSERSEYENKKGKDRELKRNGKSAAESSKSSSTARKRKSEAARDKNLKKIKVVTEVVSVEVDAEEKLSEDSVKKDEDIGNIASEKTSQDLDVSLEMEDISS